MREYYPKEYSPVLGREMECAVFSGDGDAERVCLAFPPQDGRFYDFKNFGMVESVRPWIESGKILLVCADGIDWETWSKSDGDPRARIELQERWYHYIIDELLPRYERKPWRKSLVCGCSMGGVHAGNFFFRRPDLFDAMISLSGLFNASYFFGDYMDDLVYANSPAHFLPNMPEDHPWISLYRQSKIILCCGQGAWEDDLRVGTAELDRILSAKNIPHWTDWWGYDVSHDWCWWQKQLPYFFGKLEEDKYF